MDGKTSVRSTRWIAEPMVLPTQERISEPYPYFQEITAKVRQGTPINICH